MNLNKRISWWEMEEKRLRLGLGESLKREAKVCKNKGETKTGGRGRRLATRVLQVVGKERQNKRWA